MNNTMGSVDLSRLTERQLEEVLRKLKVKNAGLASRVEETMKVSMNDITELLWPFAFPLEPVILAPNVSEKGNITVTQESAFIFTNITSTLFKEDAGKPLFADPEIRAFTKDLNSVSVKFQDSQSTRLWQDEGISMRQLGYSRFPWQLDTAYMMAPNHNLSVEFTNTSLAETYYASVCLWGYRLRLTENNEISSLVYESR